MRRDEDGVTVSSLSARSERFDAVVMATHADVALSLLNDADSAERKALGLFEYTTNEVVLHTDESLLPRHRGARGSWNVETDDCRRPGKQLVMSYWMNNLQQLDSPVQYLTSVNPGDRISDEKVIVARPMSHPKYTFDTLDGQAAMGALQGHRQTFYAGAHLGYGFHEDGCRSGFQAAEMIAAAAVQEAVDLLDVAMRLTGINKPWYPTVKACSLFIGEQVEDAMTVAEVVLDYQPNNLEAHVVLVAAQAELGMNRRATSTVKAINDKFPSVDAVDWLDQNPYMDLDRVKYWKDALEKTIAAAV